VTPSLDRAGNVVGYHSNRRKPTAEQIGRIAPIYGALLDEERRPANKREGLHGSTDYLHAVLHDRGMSYDQFVFSL
jgi:hypothetical protein